MHVHVLAVGKIKERALRELIDDYAKRIGRYATYHELELKDAEHAELEERIKKAIPARARVYALEVEGKALSSHELAALVGKAEDTSVMHLVFLIGGSYGLPPASLAEVLLDTYFQPGKLPASLADYLRRFISERLIIRPKTP